MQNIIIAIATPIITGVTTGLVVWAIERRREKHDALKEEAEEVDRKVNNATMQLAYATAIAVEQHKTNGELKRAKQAYNEAVADQRALGQKLIDSQKK